MNRPLDIHLYDKKKNIYIEYIMAKGQTGGRRTRRVNAWAKAAGEYYRSHKNDPDIKEFSDVLKSPKFKAYYQSKYGNKKYQPSFKSTRKASRGRFGKSRRYNKYEENDVMEEEEQEIVYKGKKGKEKARKEVDDWSWGFDKKNFKEEEQQQDENQKEQRFQKNELFNGGKKGGKKNAKKGGTCGKQQKQQNEEEQQKSWDEQEQQQEEEE
jgi:hypothetical protein